jgi:hypothetical protein
MAERTKLQWHGRTDKRIAGMFILDFALVNTMSATVLLLYASSGHELVLKRAADAYQPPHVDVVFASSLPVCYWFNKCVIDSFPRVSIEGVGCSETCL